MGFTTVGSFIEEIRKIKKMTRKKLSYGICSEHALREIEEDRNAVDILMFDVFIQRLGISSDKFEMVLSKETYDMIRLRDLIAETIYRGKRRLAERLLQNYPSHTRIDQMYQQRMKAGLSYCIDGDCALAAEYLQKAVSVTLPDFSYERMDAYLISSVEMENLLALERMCVEAGLEDENMRGQVKNHLGICMNYIESHFEDEEERAKLISKCAWLTGGLYYMDKNYVQTMAYCEKGIEGLRKNTILYFMLPLLKLMTKAEEALGIAPERSKRMRYYEILSFLWEGYAKRWYPTDSLFHNCYQRDYHLDYELIGAERKSRKMTQAELAEGVYQNTESYSRMETGKVSLSKKNFEKLMGKLGIEKNRYNGCVVTDSLEVMELKTRVDKSAMRRNYEQARDTVRELKKKLDMDISENKLVVDLYEIVIAKCLGEITAEEALVKLKALSRGFMDFDNNIFSHIPMKNEALVVNNICITLCETGQVNNAIDLYRITLEKIRSSKIEIKYRYRSYEIILNNYVHECGIMEYTIEELHNELLCGKAMELSFCLNNILQILNRGGVSRDECDEWAKAVYYMCDLYYLEKDKEMYKDYLKNKRQIRIMD